MGNSQKDSPLILGLDVGANSVGWALLSAAKHPRDKRLVPTGLVACGVRVFEAGVEGNLEGGRDDPRGVTRRQARAMRRLLDRRARRCDKLFRLLQGAGLLPPGGPPRASSPPDTATRCRLRAARAKARAELLNKLDSQLRKGLHAKLRAEGVEEGILERLPQTLPYLLRARALDHPLEPYELGRALYHLGQRRGFMSNRKAPVKDKKEESAVKEGIARIREEMREAGARTLGEYFAGIDPEDRRIRGRWTARDMYEDEFERIWSVQERHHPNILTPQLKERIHRAIFFQRPLKIRKEFIGACAHEPKRKRAPIALLEAQRFRLIEQVNNTRIQMPDGTVVPLSPDQRTKLVEALETKGDLTFSKAKKLLGLHPHAQFNFERGEEKRFVGNRTAAALAKVCGDRWTELAPDDKKRLVEDLRSIQKPETLACRARRVWGLGPDQAARLAELRLEDGYCRLSRQAIAKLLPLMEQGLTYQEAVGKVYGHAAPTATVPLLPPVAEALPELRNPAVSRALTELRKVVNAIIREYGRPDIVRIELARDLRRSRKQRARAARKMARYRKQREDAERRLRELGVQNPTRADIEKVLLWDECGGICPYTGKSISFASLFGAQPQFDVEHIIPRSRSLDNSFFNKTLCEINENRTRKRNRTPREAYASDPDRWNEIIQRVKKFQGDAAREKLRRFQEEPDFDDFVARQLNDTRNASRLAAKYLALLYGPQARSRVQVTRGGVTRYLRDVWDLNTILGDGPSKSRDDHRHHAVDAIAIALTERATIKMLSEAAEKVERTGRSGFAPVPPPWPDFLDEVRAAVRDINVSHRVSRKVSGPLHAETFYSPNHTDPDGNPCVHVRKPLASLSTEEVQQIVDPAVREAVEAKLAQLGVRKPEQAFADPANHPFLRRRNGTPTQVHRVRIRKRLATFPVGTGHRQRHVVSKVNHHVEIVETRDEKGNPRWEGHLVNLFEAYQRHYKERLPVVRRDHGPDKKFLFSLAPSESVMVTDEDGDHLWRVICISQDKSGRVQFEFRLHTDARPMKELRQTKGARIRKSPDALRKLNARKVLVDPLGRIRRVGHD